jgi:hypothetical protein
VQYGRHDQRGAQARRHACRPAINAVSASEELLQHEAVTKPER